MHVGGASLVIRFPGKTSLFPDLTPFEFSHPLVTPPPFFCFAFSPNVGTPFLIGTLLFL